MIIFSEIWKKIFDWWFSWFVLDPDNVLEEDKEDDKTPQEQS